MLKSLAFIGLGVMGAPMAGHLLAAGHSLIVHTRTRAKAADLIARGARWADSPADCAKLADIILLCVTDTPDVEAVLVGASGVIAAARPGLLVVDHSTISPSRTRDFARQLAKKRATLLDAPVSGGDVGARNGTLSIMVGGEPAPFDTVRPILGAYGKSITLCGPSGAGQLTKLVNQVLVSVTNLAVCEALNFARKAGLDTAAVLQAVSGGAAGSWQLSNLGPKMLAADFAPGFTIDLQQKDLRLVMQAAAESRAPLPAAALVHQLFTAAQAKGFGGRGTQALFQVVQSLAGA